MDDFEIGILVLGLASIFFICNLWGLPEKVDIRLSRQIVPDETFGGETIRLESHVQNRTASRLVNVEVVEALPAEIQPEKGLQRNMTTIESHGEARHLIEFPSPPRANYRIGPLTIRIRDPMGMYLAEEELPAQTLSVMPRPERLVTVKLRPRRVGPWPGAIPSKVLGMGSEFYSIREYVNGDDPKRINWKASARHNSLIVNETEAERVTDIMIVLDTDVTLFGAVEGEVFERGVHAAASIARVLLRQGNRVGLVLQGGERGSVPASFGKRHERRILYLLAAAKPGRPTVSTSYVINLLARRMVPSRAQIVIISPLLDPEVKTGIQQLATAGYALLVISPTPSTPQIFHHATDRTAFRLVLLERSIALSALERSATVIDWPGEIPLSAVMTRVRQRRPTIAA